MMKLKVPLSLHERVNGVSIEIDKLKNGSHKIQILFQRCWMLDDAQVSCWIFLEIIFNLTIICFLFRSMLTMRTLLVTRMKIPYRK
jgi:hypothetical protein